MAGLEFVYEGSFPGTLTRAIDTKVQYPRPVSWFLVRIKGYGSFNVRSDPDGNTQYLFVVSTPERNVHHVVSTEYRLDSNTTQVTFISWLLEANKIARNFERCGFRRVFHGGLALLVRVTDQ